MKPLNEMNPKNKPNDRTFSSPICIYCRKTGAEHFTNVEHVIPQSFGTFGAETPTLDCVCDECNAYFGKELDQVFARETVEGVTRYNKGIYSRESRPQTRLRITLPETPEMGDAAGVITWVDGQTGLLMLPPLQVHFLDKNTGQYVVLTEPELVSLNWKERGYSDNKIKIVASAPEAYDRALQMLEQIGIQYKPHSEIPNPLPGTSIDGKVEVKVTRTIDHVTKRAISKILFNYAAKYLGAVETLKPEWDKARKYIRHDAEPLKARVSAKPFWGQESQEWRLQDDSYNMRIDNTDNGVVGALQMYNLNTYEILLIDGGTIDQEVAMRFTPGDRPLVARKMTGEQFNKYLTNEDDVE